MTEVKAIENNDTTRNQIEYSYDKNGNILFKKEFQTAYDEKYKYTTEYKYDNNENLIELSFKSNFGTRKSIYRYNSDNRIVRIKEFANGQIEKETDYDDFYNPIFIKLYDNGLLIKEIEYDYDFDHNGNWIKRIVSWKEYKGKSNNWIPVYYETRTITYF